MPLSAGRRFEVVTKRTRNDPGTNRRGSNEELVVAEIGQVGTQFDTFSHQTIGASMYNCVTLDEVATRTGFTKLGVEQVGALVTRGVLIDVAALKGVPMLADTYEITPQDLQQALAAQKLTLQPGDAVLVHTGWGTLWGKDNARYQKTSPGLGIAAAEWLAKQDPMLVGADNSAVEVAPPSRPAAGRPGPPDPARGQRHPSAREPAARRAGRQPGLRVRAGGRAAQDPGRHRIDGGADRHPLSRPPGRGEHRHGA